MFVSVEGTLDKELGAIPTLPLPKGGVPKGKPTPAHPQGRGAERKVIWAILLSNKTYKSYKTHKSHNTNKPLPPFGGIVGGYQYGPYY